METSLSINKFPVVLVIVLLLGLLLIAVTQAVPGTHAVERHGDMAERVRNCLDMNGALYILINPATGRQARICQLESDLWGIQIVEEEDGTMKEVTSFPQRNRYLNDVLRYLNGRGYWQ
jgi:hypothetical protein